MKADLAFCGCMILWAVGFIGAELGVTPSDIKELVPTMTPTTITILAVAAYFAVGYLVSLWAYASCVELTLPEGCYFDRKESAAILFFAWPLGLLFKVLSVVIRFATRPHRYFAALVKKLNTPAPVQVSGAFAKGLEEGRGGYLASDPMERFTHGGRIWEPVSITSSFPGESFMSCRAVDDTESGKQAR
jgi:hypothetical protein